MAKLFEVSVDNRKDIIVVIADTLIDVITALPPTLSSKICKIDKRDHEVHISPKVLEDMRAKVVEIKKLISEEPCD